MPFWTEILELVREAALTVTPLKYLGWDVAIGPRGAVIVEANPAHNIFSLQVAAGGLRHTAIGQAVMGGATPPGAA